MIENGMAIKLYLSLMLKDYATALGDTTWAPLDNKLSELRESLPVLIQANEHYKNSSDEFLKLGKPIPRLKDIVEFYRELIELLDNRYTHDYAILVNGLLAGSGLALVRMDQTGKASNLMAELAALIFDSLLEPKEDEEFDRLLAQITAIFEEIPSPEQVSSRFSLSDEIIAINSERHKALLTAWFELLDNYWIARSLK